jgi:hypothetical protein
MSLAKNLFLAAVFVFCELGHPAFGQAGAAGATCMSLSAAISGDTSASQSTSTRPVDDRLLAEWPTALPCLVTFLRTLKQTVTSPQFEASPKMLGEFLRATGAVRTIMANNAQRLSEIIEKFRELTDLDVTSVLTYGARSDDYNARLNAMFILANVIDNTTVCVPLDHLYDPLISINGRANLLSIVSVVAPWAYKENYDNISRARSFMLNKVPKDDPNFKQTNDILSNIDLRLKSQTNDSNKGVPIPTALQKCKNYKPSWANLNGVNLSY